ncbi:hypothetical protein [Ideonella sp.]|uniref:hypothetical protein n=1 Tax=Ideonella sp. TaxID=1929293 RepID=UPI0035B2A04C
MKKQKFLNAGSLCTQALCGALLLGLAGAAMAGSVVKVQTSEPSAAVSVKEYQDESLTARAVASASKSALSLRLQDGTNREIQLSRDVERVDLMARHGDRLAIVNQLFGGGAEVMVVDWKSGEVVDRFWCYAPSLSPDHSSIAFVRFYPTHFVNSPESQYRVYRLDRTPAQNRQSSKDQAAGIGSPAADLGLAVYPTGRRAMRPNVEVPEAEAHQHMSTLVWSRDSKALAFVDAIGPKVEAVVVKVGATRDEVGHWSWPLDKLDDVCIRGMAKDGCSTVSINDFGVDLDVPQARLQITLPKSSLFPNGYSRALTLPAEAVR